MEEKDMKKIYEKPIVSEVVFKEPIMLISASVHDTNAQGDIPIPNSGESGDMWNDARSKGGRGFWDDEE